MEIPERAVQLKHVHVTQRFDVREGGVVFTLNLANRTPQPLRFRIEAFEVNGTRPAPPQVKDEGGLLNGGEIADVSIDGVFSVPGWRHGLPTWIGFSFTLLYGRPDRPFERANKRRGVVDLEADGGYSVDYETDIDEALK